MIFTKVDALVSLKPNAEFAMVGGVLKWLDLKQTKPTDSEIDAELLRLQSEYLNNKYQRDRAAAYPSIEYQLDSLYRDIIAGKVDSTGEFARGIHAVKQAYPKP